MGRPSARVGLSVRHFRRARLAALERHETSRARARTPRPAQNLRLHLEPQVLSGYGCALRPSGAAHRWAGEEGTVESPHPRPGYGLRQHHGDRPLEPPARHRDRRALERRRCRATDRTRSRRDSRRTGKARMKDEGGRMKGMLPCLESFYFILPPSSFILYLTWDGQAIEVLFAALRVWPHRRLGRRFRFGLRCGIVFNPGPVVVRFDDSHIGAATLEVRVSDAHTKVHDLPAVEDEVFVGEGIGREPVSPVYLLAVGL